jgi:hypothetical protein
VWILDDMDNAKYTSIVTLAKNAVRGDLTALFNLIKGGEFDACGCYVSFQNGERILDEFQCIQIHLLIQISTMFHCNI